MSFGAFAARLCSDFEQELGQDAPHFKRRVIHELKLALPPHAGRPRLDTATSATGLRFQGAPWKRIYPRCISDYCSLDRDSRRLAEYNLRCAVRSRRNAAQRRELRRGAHLALRAPTMEVKGHV